MPDPKKPVCCDRPTRRMTICQPNGPGRIPVGYLCLICKKIVVSLELPAIAAPVPEAEPEKLVSVQPTCTNCGLLEWMRTNQMVPPDADSCGLEKVCGEEWFWQYWTSIPEVEKP